MENKRVAGSGDTFPFIHKAGKEYIMSIITVSRGSYSRGREVAERVARELGYECISRDILIEASEQFNIPEIKLIRAIHDSPSVLERFTYGKEKYIAYIRAAFLKHAQKDNMAYHGIAGHFFLQGIPHVLKVRIIAEMENRVKEEMRREGISEQEARFILKKDDEERRKWGIALYGVDTWDAKLYDLVCHIDTMSVSDAVDIILCALKRPCFQTTPESQRLVDNLALAAQVKAALVEEFPVVDVSAKNGMVWIHMKIPLSHAKSMTERAKNIAAVVPGVKDVDVHISPVMMED